MISSTLQSFAADLARAQAALQYAIACASRMDAAGILGPVTLPSGMYAAVCAHPSAEILDTETCSIATVRVGMVVIEAVRLRLRAGED